MTGERRPYHHGNLREALLEAAEVLLEAGGVQRLSLRELGRGLGVSHSAAQRHFADKQDLLDAVAERGFERLGAAFGAAVADRDGGFDERLRRLAHAHVGFALRHPALFRWMIEAKSQLRAPPGLLRASDAVLAHAAGVFADGQAAGAVAAGDLAHLCLAAYAAVQGLVAVSTGGRVGGQPLDALVDGIVERIILGLRPRA